MATYSRFVVRLGGLLVLCGWLVSAGNAENPAGLGPELGEADLVQVPATELERIQHELQYLRMRDAERQAWQDSVMSRLPETNFEFASHRRSTSSAAESGMSSCSSCGRCECSGCACHDGGGGYLCQCPLPQAPCINCPRVSTLNPYFNVNVFGALKLDMLFSGPRNIARGTPFFLSPGSATGLNQDTVSIHARQSTIGATFAGPQFGGFQSGGLFMAMFYNDAVIVDRYGFLPLQAYGELRNEDWRFAAGLQFDVFAPGLPTVLPFSALAASGNAGNSFRGQVRLERFLYPAEDRQWTIQFALSEPVTTTVDPLFGLSEDNGWPNVEGRIAYGLGPVQNAGLATFRPIEFGVSGVVGQIRTTPPPPDDRVVADVWGLAGDFRLTLSERWGFTGEFYTGQTLGTYNAGILQGINVDTLEAIRSVGGWAETYFYWTPCLHSHTGFGIDDPLDRDVAASIDALGRVRNAVYYTNLLWDLNPTFRIGFEFTWRETNYKSLPDNDGPGFHTQFQWSF